MISDKILSMLSLYQNQPVLAARGDGSTVSGTLEACAPGTGVIRIDGTLLSLEELTDLEYRGKVTACKTLQNTGEIDNRLPFQWGDLRTKETGELLRFQEDECSVACHLKMAEGRICACDVRVLDKTAVPARKQEEHYGIVLVVDFSKRNGRIGYLGREYVAKACGDTVRGNACFNRTQLDFEIEYNKIYVVKYTLRPKSRRSLRFVAQMSLFRVLDARKYGIVRVSEQGEIEAVPLFRAGIKYYENRDVDVLCQDGTVCAGLLTGHDEQRITVCTGRGSQAEEKTIPFAEVTQIRLVGTVTQFYSNGTGYVDNGFFFHVNELAEPSEAQLVRRGAQLVYTLRCTRKGNYVDCGEIRVLPETRRDVYVIDHGPEGYTVIDAEKYESGSRAPADCYLIPYFAYNPFRNLKSEDYHAILTLRRRAGVQECATIRTISSRPKLQS